MPFTPFHFGPGAALKAMAPAWFSLGVFCFSQVVVDLESGYHLLLGDYPIHRFLHTYLGATLSAPICAVAGKYLCDYVLRAMKDGGLRVAAGIRWSAALFGAFLGTESHVFLDSIMHPDMVPFAPWSRANPLLHLICFWSLHLLCLVLGAFGLLAIMARQCRKKGAERSRTAGKSNPI
jgi:hypothetical protein